MVDADANDLLVDLAELAMKRREELGLPAWLLVDRIGAVAGGAPKRDQKVARMKSGRQAVNAPGLHPATDW